MIHITTNQHQSRAGKKHDPYAFCLEVCTSSLQLTSTYVKYKYVKLSDVVGNTFFHYCIELFDICWVFFSEIGVMIFKSPEIL